MSEREKSSCPDSLDQQLPLEILCRLDEGQIKGLLAALQAKPELEGALRKALSLCWDGEQPYTPQQTLADFSGWRSPGGPRPPRGPGEQRLWPVTCPETGCACAGAGCWPCCSG